jgi:hypothetical protein
MRVVVGQGGRCSRSTPGAAATAVVSRVEFAHPPCPQPACKTGTSPPSALLPNTHLEHVHGVGQEIGHKGGRVLLLGPQELQQPRGHDGAHEVNAHATCSTHVGFHLGSNTTDRMHILVDVVVGGCNVGGSRGGGEWGVCRGTCITYHPHPGAT